MMDPVNSASRIPEPGSRVAVVGSGISGLASAWLLSQRYSVTLFESGAYFGGHSNTVDVTIDGVTHPVDTGFLVHNDLTYPNLIALFQHLGVPVHQSDMSFGVSIESPDIEWAGSSLATVFAQKSLLFNPRFLGMLREILRFNRDANQYLQTCSAQPDLTLGELLKLHGYGHAMQYWYLLPMAAAIWSSSVRDILSFPAATFLRFCLNHRLLQVEGRPQWRTVLGGSKVYVQAMLKSIEDARLNSPVLEISRRHLLEGASTKNPQYGHGAAGIVVRTANSTEVFDAVVMACHAPTSDCSMRRIKSATFWAGFAIRPMKLSCIQTRLCCLGARRFGQRGIICRPRHGTTRMRSRSVTSSTGCSRFHLIPL